MFNRILVALDQSPLSEQVFEAGVAMAKALNAQLMLAHVLSPVGSVFSNSTFAVYGAYPVLREDVDFYVQQWRAKETQGIEFLKQKTDIATAAGISTEFTQILGDPGHSICTMARNWNASLILIGRRGFTGLGEFFVGSVSNYVTHHAPCSVLTIQGLEQGLETATEAADPAATTTAAAS
jgi:nucleotide-binding universal stress UspA family protein